VRAQYVPHSQKRCTFAPAWNVTRSLLGLSFLLSALPLAMAAADVPACDSSIKAIHQELLPFVPPRTEYVPRGYLIVEFIVQPTGEVSDARIVESHVPASDSFVLENARRSMKTWRFKPRENACRGKKRISFELRPDAEQPPAKA
jgi:TonB family protein